MSGKNINIAVFIVLAALLLLGSTVAASANDLPGEPLYPVKIAAENATLALSFSDEAKASKLLDMATERVAEIEEIEEIEDDPDEIADEELIDETEELLTDELNDLAEIGESTSDETKSEIIAKLQALDARHDAVMARVYEQVPDQAKPSIQKAMENSKRGHARAIEALSKEHGKDNAPGQDASRDVDDDPSSSDVNDASDDAEDQDSIDDEDSDNDDPAKVEDEDDQDPDDIGESEDGSSSNNGAQNNGNGKSDESHGNSDK